MQIDLTGLPPLDFGNPPEGIEPASVHWHGSLGMRVCAYMTWPNDGEKRRRFLAAIAAKKMGDVESVPLPSNYPAQRSRSWDEARRDVSREIADIDFIPHGGLLSVASAESLQTLFALIRKRTDTWSCVGSQLWICRSIDMHHRDVANKGASINKVWSIMEKTTPWNLARLKKDWADFKSVAHFCAAATLLLARTQLLAARGSIPVDHILLAPGAWFFDGLPFLLATARDYGKWASLYVPFGRENALISASHMWSVPNDFPSWDYSVEPLPLDPQHLAALSDYKAPKRPE